MIAMLTTPSLLLVRRRVRLQFFASLIAIFVIFGNHRAVMAQQGRIAACRQPVDFGACSLSVIRYYYDSAMDTCRVFIYGGCDGNDNRFDSREQCTRICNAGPEQPSNNNAQHFPTFNDDASSICSLPADPGTCTDTNLIQYYYDTVTDSCRLFVYGGCGGNANRFRTKLTCQVACGGVNDADDDTPAPPPPPPVRTTQAATQPFYQRVTRTTTTSAPLVRYTRSTPYRVPQTTMLPMRRAQAAANLCVQPTRVLQPKTFNYRSSFMHIFPQLVISCAGVVRSWSFISRVTLADGLYLAVFRARTPSNNATAYSLVGMTSIYQYKVARNTWVDYAVPEGKQFNVNAGDVLGLFYENWDITDDISVVALADKYSPDYEALVSPLNLLAHVQQRGRDSIVYDMNYQGFVDATLSVRTFRYPAMRVSIDPNGRASGTTSAPDNFIAGQLPISPKTTPNPGNSPSCLDEFQTSQTCLDNALRRGVDSRVFKARWFFDITVKMCAMFWYVPDCYRSANLFETEYECRATCYGYMATTTPRDLK